MCSPTFTERRVYCLVRRQSIVRVPITPATLLRRDLSLDAVDRVLLGISLEQWLRIDIPDTQLGQWRTVADVLECVSRCRQANP